MNAYLKVAAVGLALVLIAALSVLFFVRVNDLNELDRRITELEQFELDRYNGPGNP